MSNGYNDRMLMQRKRDLQIMRYLAAGPANGKVIRNLFFRDANNMPLSRQVAERRLKKLCEQGRIVELKYCDQHGRVEKYYVLSDFGASEVSTAYLLSRESIRVLKPPKHRLRHELKIAEVIRTIDREVEQKKYQLGYLYDDCTMRQTMGTKKGTYYCDLCCEIIPSSGEPISTFIEYDGGTKSDSYWSSKLKNWKGLVLILCDHLDRIAQMKRYVRNSLRLGATALALHADFVRYGLAETEWLWLPKNIKGQINI